MNKQSFREQVEKIKRERLAVLSYLYSDCGVGTSVPALHLSQGTRDVIDVSSLTRSLHYLSRLGFIMIAQHEPNTRFNDLLISIEPKGIDYLMGLRKCKGIADISMLNVELC